MVGEEIVWHGLDEIHHSLQTLWTSGSVLSTFQVAATNLFYIVYIVWEHGLQFPAACRLRPPPCCRNGRKPCKMLLDRNNDAVHFAT